MSTDAAFIASDDTVELVLAVARLGPIFPMGPDKRPLTPHGSKDATQDEVTIREWWTERPDAAPTLMTGRAVVILDVDVKNGANGVDTLEMQFGVSVEPATPTDFSPNGGHHCLFTAPSYPVRSGTLGPGLEVKASRAWCTLAPGPGRFWDPILDLSTPLAPMPSWMVLPEPRRAETKAERPKYSRLSAYAEAALDSAAKCIMSAPAGRQELTLNTECYGIGRLAGGGVIAPALALESLLWAARKMPSHDAHRPWRIPDLERKVKDAFMDGLQQPRTVPNGRS
ncbi:MAG TPA: bifunctional DNA primase/polymerase [Stellaceae bacterium]|nr:bifunctional DNA primase/polymerase [Stellaceae bacterium]